METVREMSSRLPDFKKELDALNSDSFQEYEKKLNDATNNAIDALNDIIDDGTLKMDPEQLVKAVETLTKARKDISEQKRKLIETIIRGEVMMKALEPKKDASTSLLEDYLKKEAVDGTAKECSIFQQVSKE